MAQMQKTLEKVVEKALDEKDKYHKIIGHIKAEKKQEEAVNQRLRAKEEKRLSTQ